MSVDKKNLAAQCWKVGSEAMLKQNWDYAIDMFTKCVQFVPDNLVYRQTLRGVERRKYKDNKTGAAMAGMKLMGPRGRIKKGQVSKKWADVDAAAEEGLAINPWDAALHADLGEATRNLGYTDIAAYAYQQAVENDPKNKAYLRSLAELLETKGEFTQAAALWDRICKLDPLDGEARSRASHAATQHVIDRGGYEGADDTKAVMADHEVQKRLNAAKGTNAPGPGQSEEADLQRAIRKEPDNKDNYLKLGDLLRREGRHEEAGQMYQKALEISGGDATIREQMEDTELDFMKKNVMLARERAEGGDDEAKQSYDELKRELRLREMTVLRNRVDRYPSNLQFKFTLAELCMQEKKYGDAIQLFQQSSSDTRLEAKSLFNMGLCFIQEKKYPLARRQLEKAVPKLNAKDHRDMFLEVHYWLGRLCEQAKDLEAAEAHYGEVLTVDYGYKDALSRIEKLQGGAE